MAQLPATGVIVSPVPSAAAALPVLDKQELTLPVGEMDTSEIAPGQSVSEGSSPTSPQLPLPDFLTALNMQAQHLAQSNGGTKQEGVVKSEGMVVGPGPKQVLLDNFKKGLWKYS